MSTENFQLAYDGPALREGSMDVYDLAPALISVGDLVRDVNHIVNQDRASVSVQVQSDFRTGSFEISLIIDQNLLETAKALLFAGSVANAQDLVKIIFGESGAGKVISGILKLYKMWHGEKPEKSNVPTITMGDVIVMGDVHIDSKTFRAYSDDQVRRHLDRIVRPISKPGIDKLQARKNKAVIEEVKKADLPERVADPDNESGEDKSLTNTREAILKVVTANFDNGKWKFSDGTAKFNADIEDPIFKGKLDRREIGFFKGDSLHVKLTTVQTEGANGKLHTVYSIKEVIEHREAPKQPALLGE